MFLLKPKCARKQLRADYTIPSVSVEIMLEITMRILAGASYLDVGWTYRQSTSSVYNIFHETLSALEKVLSKTKFPKTE